MAESGEEKAEVSGRCLGASPDTCRAIANKPFVVRGKITFALGVEAENARHAEERVRDDLNRLVGIAPLDYKLPPIIHEWEVLTEQIERSE